MRAATGRGWKRSARPGGGRALPGAAHREGTLWLGDPHGRGRIFAPDEGRSLPMTRNTLYKIVSFSVPVQILRDGSENRASPGSARATESVSGAKFAIGAVSPRKGSSRVRRARIAPVSRPVRSSGQRPTAPRAGASLPPAAGRCPLLVARRFRSMGSRARYDVSAADMGVSHNPRSEGHGSTDPENRRLAARTKGVPK